MGHILKIEPIFKETIWGGEKLKSVFNYEIPSSHTGECWGISGHRNGDCKIANSEYKGLSLSKVYNEHRELFGNVSGEDFPLLIKIIDANMDLSVQVHPDDAYAKENEKSLGKNEMWYILGAESGANLIMGHRAQNKEELIAAIESDDYEALLNKTRVNVGEAYYIPAGTLHAIGSGVMCYEIQQSSDITYRVYDYHRKDKNGQERELKIKKALDVISIPSDLNRYKCSPDNEGCLMKNEFFTLYKHDIKGSRILKNDKPFLLITVVGGQGLLENETVKAGDNFIVCSDVETIKLEGNLSIMLASL